MENKRMKMVYRLLMTVFIATLVAGVATAQEAEAEVEADTGNDKDTLAKLGAGIALAGCGIGTGLAQGPIGAAAVGMIAEDGSKFGLALLFTVLPETIVLFGFLTLFLL
ncbi:MAG: V-type ATP synthase subunit K [Candidatus Poseidoniia archaeon]|jgi:V/A-type H+-transporting ATPase subunit K